MPSIVLFRAVNVGGHQVFRPAKLAAELKAFGVVNIGAVGTFVVREEVAPARLRAEILRRLPFQPELVICTDADVLALLRRDWFGKEADQPGVDRFVSVLGQTSSLKLPLPFDEPAGGQWEVRIVAVTGSFVLSLRRRGRTYSNAVVEKRLGVPATTRKWDTFEAIREVLAG
jgi:uncharacterized protein (DUF1697 family)